MRRINEMSAWEEAEVGGLNKDRNAVHLLYETTSLR